MRLSWSSACAQPWTVKFPDGNDPVLPQLHAARGWVLNFRLRFDYPTLKFQESQRIFLNRQRVSFVSRHNLVRHTVFPFLCGGQNKQSSIFWQFVFADLCRADFSWHFDPWPWLKYISTKPVRHERWQHGKKLSCPSWSFCQLLPVSLPMSSNSIWMTWLKWNMG